MALPPLPLSYYEHFLEVLIERGDVEFITYDDLTWEDDTDYHNNYPKEWKQWLAAVRDGRRSPDKAYVLLQHDTDLGPNETLRMAEIERRLGVRSTIMTFVNWRDITRTRLAPYPIDWDLLKTLEAQGFCIGYHCNALQNAQFNPEEAYALFREDLDYLSQRFALKFFSPHGGRRGPDGQTNNMLDYPEACPTPFRWVHNRFSPSFSSAYSDGALVPRLAKGDNTTDLRAWLDRLTPGRHRILIHAQYYRDEDFARCATAQPAWYNDFIDRTAAQGPGDASREFWRGPRPAMTPAKRGA